MEYKVNIHGILDVDLYADADSAKKLVTSVSGENAAKKFVALAVFSNKLIKVQKVIAKKKVAAKVAAIKKPVKKVGKRKK